MRFISLLCLIFLVCSLLTAQNYTPVFKPSSNPPFKIKKDQNYTFGYLKVPENREKKDSPLIKLPVYIFKSRSKNPAKDPVLFTVGGPGNSSMRNAPYMQYYKYLDDRDFILFEQRGTTYAKPHLDCPEWAEAMYQSQISSLSDQQSDSIFRQAAIRCRDRLTNKGIDLNAYNTRAIAADIEDLRIALGIEKLNLLTLSYSTKIAQVLIRDYPESIRSVVMDSPLPLEVSYEEESISNLLETYNKIFADCEAQPECNTAFPDLKNRFYRFLKEKTMDPEIFIVKNPENEQQISLKYEGKDFISLYGSVSTSQVPDFPQMIENVISGDYSLIESELPSLIEGPGSGTGRAMRLSVWCAEEFPFVDIKVVKQQMDANPAIKGLGSWVFEPEICRVWNVQAEGLRENEAVKSDIPVLLITGEYDNETPPRWANDMQKNLSNSFHLIFKGWKHGPTTYWSNPCAMNMANEFFNDPTRKPQNECFEQIMTPAFVVEKE